MENQNENQTETTETENQTAAAAKAPKEPKTPAWVLLMEANRAKIVALGLEEEEQENFVQVKHAETGHRIYVAKQERAVKSIPTTMPLGGSDLGAEFSGTNGKIAAEIFPEKLGDALEALADGRFGKVRPSKRQPKVAAPEQPAATETTETASAE